MRGLVGSQRGGGRGDGRRQRGIERERAERSLIVCRQCEVDTRYRRQSVNHFVGRSDLHFQSLERTCAHWKR